jgi:hypothetical protein
MVRVYFEYHNPVCDCCGHTLGAERDDEAAEAAMKADGWHKVEGKDLCRLCWQHYEETGRMPRKLIFYKEETNMEEVSNKKDLEEIEATEGCADACPVEGAAESSTTAEATTSLSQDMIHAVANEVRRREDATYHSAYESYAILSAELEIKAAVEKDLKKAMSELWDGVKAEDDDVVSAYLQNIARVARESAMAWVRVAAIAEKAGDEL